MKGMITREELLRSPEYWFEGAQNELYRQVVEYMEREGINRKQLAEKLGVTKGYVSQILNGNFNYTLKRLIDLALAIGLVPRIQYQNLEALIKADKATKPKRPTTQRVEVRKIRQRRKKVIS